MKIKISALTWIIGLILVASCDDDFLEENPEGILLEEGFLNSNEDIDLALTALFSKNNGTVQFNDFAVLTAGGDDVTSKLEEGEVLDFDLFRRNDQNSLLLWQWQVFYDLVSSANFIINNIEQATDATQEKRTTAEAIAKFMRGHAYFYLVRNWNEVPLITDNKVDQNIVPSSPEEVYELIVSDLTFAEENLQDAYTDYPNNNVPPTVGAAKSVLAAVYLTMAGYPVNDPDGYTLAAEKSKEVIDNAATWGYQLLDNFGDLWVDQPFNNEIVFAAYFENEGGDIEFNNHNATASNFAKPPGLGGWSTYFSELGFFDRFPEGARKDETFFITYEVDSELVSWEQDNTDPGVIPHPHYRKMAVDDDQIALWNSDRTTFIVRYAEVLLTYAEAQARATGSPNADAYRAVNQVRNRAGLEDLSPGLDGASFADLVVQERAWEFAGFEYAARWYDLVRLELVEEANSDANRITQDDVAEGEPYDFDIIGDVSDRKNWFAPYPTSEVQQNSNLSNN